MKVNSMLTLYIYVNSENEELRDFYKNRIEEHNKKSLNKYADSGFDLGMPISLTVKNNDIGVKIPLEVHCSMYDANGRPHAYYLYPRSSIIKTPLRLSNSVGIIDRGYRGSITAVVDNLNNSDFQLDKFNRYFQICHPNLEPFHVILVDELNQLGSTERNHGGFGSTGI